MKLTVLTAVGVAALWLASAGGEPAAGAAPEAGLGQASNLIPNGSFEFWDYFSDTALGYKQGRLWVQNPTVPARWVVGVQQPASVKPSPDAHGGKTAAAFIVSKHALASLEMGQIELLPGGRYSFGCWIKGKGRVNLSVNGLVVEGWQGLAEAQAEAGDEWRVAQGTFTVPSHIRTVVVRLAIAGESELRVDDVFVSAPLAEPYEADAVLGKKYVRDEYTVFFEDFDGPSPAVVPSSKEMAVTDPQGGRFGKGFRLDRRGSATIPLNLAGMPEEGTLEFWIACDSPNGLTHLALMGRDTLLSIGNGPSGMDIGSRYPELREVVAMKGYSSETDVNRMRPGVWHHFAFTWDRQTVRLYVDGVLGSMKTVESFRWPEAPSFIQLRSPFPNLKHADATIDEIRISSTRRYGPAIPAGMAYVPPFRLPNLSAQVGRSDKILTGKTAPSAEQIAGARKAQLGSIPAADPGTHEETPNPAGDYVYEAASARPLVKGGLCQVETNKAVKGLTVVRSGAGLGLSPDELTNQGVFWTLKNIRKGPYWVGVLYDGDGKSDGFSRLAVYLNGRLVQLGTQSNPVQVAPGTYYAEALAEEAADLSPGDEIAVVFTRGGATARLILHSRAPAPVSEVPWRLPRNFGGHQWNLCSALGVNAEGKFLDKTGKPAENLRYDSVNQTSPSIAALRDESGKVRFMVYLSNPLPIPVTVNYACSIKSYYGETVATEAARLTLQPHDQVARPVVFDWKEGELSHFAKLTLTAHKPPELSRRRDRGGLGWPLHESLTFFPGHRQVLPWPDAFNTRVVRRLTLAAPFGGVRQAYRLDGSDWQMGYTTKLEPPMPAPADIKFNRVGVPKSWGSPSLDSLKPRPHGAYFRRPLVLPSELAGRSFKLIVNDATCEATAYVNGKACGNVRGEDTPLVCDITRAVRPGTNELVIVVRDLLAIMNPDYVNKENPTPNAQYLLAPGIFGGNGLGLGSVKIETAPLMSSEDVLIATSVRKGTIGASITAANRGGAAARVRVTAEVLDDGKPVLDLGGQDITLAPDQPVKLTLEKPWKRPTLWEPGNPYLYALRVTLRDAKTGTVLDVRRDRFGFRESWIDGPNIMFNGYPIKPVGYGYLMRLNPRGNFMFLRGGGREWLDEIGIMGYYGISGLRNTPSQHNIESDIFWRAAESNNIAALRLRQNSPHILAWDLSNEWLCFFWGDPMQGARRFKALSDAVRAYDPTRWTLANAERDLNGLLDNYSFHYMNPYYGPPNRFTMRGVTPYLPDESFWRPLDRQFAVGEAVPYCPLNPMLLRPDQKVIMDNEFLWKCGLYMPPGPTTIMGEDNVLSAAVDTGSGPAAWLWKTCLDGHRDMGVSTINVYSYHPGVVRGAFLEQAVIIPENQRHGFAGTRHTRRFTIVNSLFRPHTMTLRWKVTEPDGGMADRGSETFKMGSGDISRGEFAFTLPEVAARSTCTLRVTLESDGEFVCGEEWDIQVEPSAVPAVGALARKMLLYDPEGVTAAALTALKVPFTKVSALTPLEGTPAQTTVIVGEHALNPYSARITASLAGFVEQGGRVVILAQKGTPSNLPVETSLEPRNWSSQVYPRAGSHPVLAGIGSHDLQFWQPDRSVGVGAYTKPFAGNFIALADGSFWDKMDWAQMMEVFRGRGAYLLCQLPVASRQAVEPVARQLLVNIVRYACSPDAYACPVKTLVAVTEPAGDTAGILQNLRIKHRVIGFEAEAEAGTPVLLDADYARQAGVEQRARWRERLRQGGEWVVLNAGPQDSAWLAELAGSRVVIAVPPYPLWDGRGFRKGWSKYTAGLSHLDLYRKRYSDDERAGGQAEDLTNILEPFQNYAAQAEQGRELLFPGALVEIRTGNGVLLLDQRRWAAQDEYLAKLVRRNVSALMTALNVGMASYVAPRELPKDLAFRTIDCASLATVRLQDPGAGAGLPALPGFPNAPRNFLNVPFALNTDGKNGIALAAARAGLPAGLPEHVTIPVGYVAEGLYFLQAAGQAGGGLAANYQVVYEDGSVFDVPVRGGIHVADWNAPAVLPGAEIAWTGSDGHHPITAVYRMLWVNHRPETPIKEVVFSNPEAKSVPVLIGLTAAARRETIPVPPEQAARARQAFEKGKTAFQQGRLDEAFNHLRDAVVTDPALKAAYQALADAAEKKGDEDRMFEAYRLWSLSGPRQPLPWNRMGEIHEKRKQTRPALDAFRKSLEIEWNQPPVMEAIRRLEADLK